MTRGDLPHPAIEVRGFSYSIGSCEILRDVSFAVAPGEYVSIIGPNGAGKTTLLKCLNRIYPGGSGEILIDGQNRHDYTRRDLAKRISYVPQAGSSAFPFTVEEFVLMGRYPYLSPLRPAGREDHQAVAEALEMTGTTDLAGRRVDTLSGGERQTVYIAAALAQGGQILLLDEPTTFLDYRHETAIREVLTKVNRRRQVTVISVTHEVNRAAIDSDSIIALRQGSMLIHASPEEIMCREVLDALYETPFLLINHPTTQLPVIVPQAPVTVDR